MNITSYGEGFGPIICRNFSIWNFFFSHFYQILALDEQQINSTDFLRYEKLSLVLYQKLFTSILQN